MISRLRWPSSGPLWVHAIRFLVLFLLVQISKAQLDIIMQRYAFCDDTYGPDLRACTGQFSCNQCVRSRTSLFYDGTQAGCGNLADYYCEEVENRGECSCIVGCEKEAEVLFKCYHSFVFTCTPDLSCELPPTKTPPTTQEPETAAPQIPQSTTAPSMSMAAAAGSSNDNPSIGSAGEEQEENGTRSSGSGKLKLGNYLVHLVFVCVCGCGGFLTW